MKNKTVAENGAAFYLDPLKPNEVGSAKELCDICVGENLYSEKELYGTVDSENGFFELLKTESGETAGYIYCRIITADGLAEYTKLDKNLLGVCKSGESIGIIQSVGIKENYRGLGLSARLVEYAAAKLFQITHTVFIVCWKVNGSVALSGALDKCGFKFLSNAENVWYDKPNLICPVCGGRCRCGAEVYYKKTGGEQ